MKKLSTAASIRILFGVSSIVVGYLSYLSNDMKIFGIAITMASISILSTQLVNFWENKINPKKKLGIRILVAAMIASLILYFLVRSGIPILKGSYLTVFMFGSLGWMITDTIKFFRKFTHNNSEPAASKQHH